MVACGYAQVAGLDYNETFAATAAMEAVRVFFAMVAARDLKLMSYDVSQAFLNALLKEDIYVRQPQGFVVDGEEGKVIKLLREENILDGSRIENTFQRQKGTLSCVCLSLLPIVW